MENRTSQSQLNWLMLCIALHIVVDFMSIREVWLPGGSLFLLIAIPIAQCSLVAIWAATSRVNLWLRFAIPPAVTLALWYLIAVLLTWDIHAGPARSWLIAFVIQVMTIAFVINLYQRWNAKRNNQKDAYAFDLRLIFVWTLVAASVFAFFQYGRMNWGWGSLRSTWEFGTYVPMIGAVNAVIALICAWPFAHLGWKPRLIRIAVALPLLAIPAVILHTLFGSTSGNLPPSALRLLAAGQAVTIAISLAMVNRWRQP